MSHVQPLNVTSSMRPVCPSISSHRFISGPYPRKSGVDAPCRTRAPRATQFPRDPALDRFLSAPYATLMTLRRFLPPFWRLSASMNPYKRDCVYPSAGPHSVPSLSPAFQTFAVHLSSVKVLPPEGMEKLNSLGPFVL